MDLSLIFRSIQFVLMSYNNLSLVQPPNQFKSNLSLLRLAEGEGFLSGFSEESRRTLKDGRLEIHYGGENKGYVLMVDWKFIMEESIRVMC